MEGTKKLIFQCCNCKQTHSLEVKKTPNPKPTQTNDITSSQRPPARKSESQTISISEDWDWEDSLFKSEDSLINLINNKK